MAFHRPSPFTVSDIKRYKLVSGSSCSHDALLYTYLRTSYTCNHTRYTYTVRRNSNPSITPNSPTDVVCVLQTCNVCLLNTDRNYLNTNKSQARDSLSLLSFFRTLSSLVFSILSLSVLCRISRVLVLLYFLSHTQSLRFFSLFRNILATPTLIICSLEMFLLSNLIPLDCFFASRHLDSVGWYSCRHTMFKHTEKQTT